LPIALRPFAAGFSRARPFAYCAAAIRRRFLLRSAICLLRCGHSPLISIALGHLPIALRPFAADFPCARPFAYCAAAIRRRFHLRSAICLLRYGHSPPISLALGHLPIALRPFAADFPCARPFAYCAAAIRRRFLSRSAFCLLRHGHSPPNSIALRHPFALPTLLIVVSHAIMHQLFKKHRGYS
jgi:hypothetical protein